ncbi:MAG TPA: tRNA lysidine(34) synthetase TilS [Xanthobacteraceae bacterium]|nr:tRNA lysidine(34) synthetase TilS [Xanthobacteraceae bacterium]
MGIADQAVRDDEASALFSGLEEVPGLLLAVSGGSDSTALLLLAARWAKRLKKRIKRSPKLLAVTVDHGLRSESAREAAAVGRLARRLGVRHIVVRWRGTKPKTGLQEAARHARYRLLAQAAARAGCEHVLTAHTLDDQAETVLFRLARGSGLTGLAGMAHALPIPVGGERAVFLVRPLLGVAKARLVATLRGARVAHSEDPSNRDPRFARTRFRVLLAQLAEEGLDARGFARLAARMRRAETTIEFAVAAARDALAPWPWHGSIVFDATRFNDLPAEVALRLLGRAVAHVGNEGPVELGKLELLYEALRKARVPLRRTLAGALVAAGGGRLVVERAPSRRQAARPTGNRRFTK